MTTKKRFVGLCLLYCFSLPSSSVSGQKNPRSKLIRNITNTPGIFLRKKGNRNEPKGNRLRPLPPRQAQAAGRYRSVALNLLADHQVAQIDAYDASESRDSQESAFFGELEIRLQDLQGYGMSAPDKTNDTVGVSVVENVAVFHILHGDVDISQHLAI